MSIYDPFIDQIKEKLKDHGPRETYRLLFEDKQEQIGGSYQAFYYFCRKRDILLQTRYRRSKGKNQDMADDAAAARAEGLTYGQYKAQEYCRAHPLVRRKKN